MNTITVYLMMGLPGSGKSSWCRTHHPDLPVVSRDLIRHELGYTSSPDEKAVLPREDEAVVTKVEYGRMLRLLEEGHGFIVDDTNINAFYRIPLVSWLREHGAKVVGVFIDTPPGVCAARRSGQIPPEAIARMHERLTPFGENEVDEAIIVRYQNHTV